MIWRREKYIPELGLTHRQNPACGHRPGGPTGQGLAQVIVAMISSRMFRANHSSRVTIRLNSPVGYQSGLLAIR